MIKGIFIGAFVVIGLVGYGVIDTDHVEEAGSRLKNGVNYVAQKVDEVTR